MGIAEVGLPEPVGLERGGRLAARRGRQRLGQRGLATRLLLRQHRRLDFLDLAGKQRLALHEVVQQHHRLDLLAQLPVLANVFDQIGQPHGNRAAEFAERRERCDVEVPGNSHGRQAVRCGTQR